MAPNHIQVIYRGECCALKSEWKSCCRVPGPHLPSILLGEGNQIPAAGATIIFFTGGVSTDRTASPNLAVWIRAREALLARGVQHSFGPAAGESWQSLRRATSKRSDMPAWTAGEVALPTLSTPPHVTPCSSTNPMHLARDIGRVVFAAAGTSIYRYSRKDCCICWDLRRRFLLLACGKRQCR